MFERWERFLKQVEDENAMVTEMSSLCNKMQNAPAGALNEQPDTDMKDAKNPPYAKQNSEHFDRPIR
jgi:hypothetical protein